MLNKTNFYRLALAAALAAVPLGGQALAQAPSANSAGAAQLHFDIPAQPLSQAALQFSDQAHVQLVFDAPLASGVSSTAVQGSYTIPDGLNHLLLGTGLAWRFLDAHTITIQRKTVQSMSGATVFGAVQVEGTSGVFADLSGFGPGAGTNGSSDVTATEGTGSLATNSASVGTGVPQALKETPQSVSVITQEQIKRQGLTDLTSALNYMPGVTLQSSSGIESNFISRGFNVTTMQVDGSAPLWLNGSGSGVEVAPDLSEYDHIEMLQGSDALSGGYGTPGGTVALDHKRPLDHSQFKLEADTGSWANERLEVDATGPMAFNGHLRGRVDIVYQNRDFSVDTMHQDKTHIYGIVEGDIGSDTLLRVGGSYGRETDPGYDMLGLPRYPNGADIGFPRSTCLCASWNSFAADTTELFAELDHRFNDSWGLKVNLQQLTNVTKAEYASVSGPVTQSSPPSANYDGIQQTNFSLRQYTASATLNGSVMALGFPQKIVAGVQYSRYPVTMSSVEGFGGSSIPVFGFNPSELDPRPQAADASSGFAFGIKNVPDQAGAFLNVMLQPMARLHVTAGFRISNASNNASSTEIVFGMSQGENKSTSHDNGVVTPSFGVTYDITKDVTAYASYASVYQTQFGKYSLTYQPLPALTGVTQEVGLKSALMDGRLNLSFAGYSTIQNNQSILQNDEMGYNGGACCFLNTGKVRAVGLDLQVSGELTPGWQIMAGYNYNREYYSAAFMNQVQSAKSGSAATYLTQQPINQVKLWTTYALPGVYKQWSVGGGMRMESARYSQGTTCSLPVDLVGDCSGGEYIPFNFVQSLYAVLDLHAGYRLDEHWNADLNVTNVTDTRYYSTDGDASAGNFYGEPRAFMLSVHAAY